MTTVSVDVDVFGEDTARLSDLAFRIFVWALSVADDDGRFACHVDQLRSRFRWAKEAPGTSLEVAFLELYSVASLRDPVDPYGPWECQFRDWRPRRGPNPTKPERRGQ